MANTGKSISNKDIKSISKVDLKSYKFIDDESQRERYGVIAQDLEKVGLEHLVVENENKKGVDYISLLILKIAELPIIRLWCVFLLQI